MSGIALPIPSARHTFDGRLASDERLARLVSRGSTQAFAVLYARHHRALSRYGRAIVGDDQDAQDVMQSAMTRALAALQAGERELWVRPWLFRIVHNEAISLLRRRRLGDVPVDDRLPALRDVERAVEERERLALLMEDLQALAERQRAALVMRELSGLSIDEIAAALATSSCAAKQALFEARCALHELAEGRAMACQAVRQLISERDGRVLRGRRLRAHLRACANCRAFHASIGARATGLRALAPPLPAVAASALLVRVVGGAAGGAGGGGAAIGSTASLGGHAVGSLTAGSLTSGSLGVKALVSVALVTAATAGTVDLTARRTPHRRAPAPALAAPRTTAVLVDGGTSLDTGREPRPARRHQPSQRLAPWKAAVRSPHAARSRGRCPRARQGLPVAGEPGAGGVLRVRSRPGAGRGSGPRQGTGKGQGHGNH